MTALTVALIAVTLALSAVIVYMVHKHQEEKKELHLRLASKSLEEYHYWRESFPLEVEHNRKILEKSRREEDDETKLLSPEQLEKLRKAREF